MKKMKYLRTWLVVALVVTIIGSLTGGTVAWFTDSVESVGNTVQSGTLKIGLNYADDAEYKGIENTAWIDVEDENVAPIFSYKYWEPGYTDLKYVQIVNNGNLAFKYQIKVVPSVTPVEGATNLADVIDVYYAIVDLNNEDITTISYTAPDSFADMTEAKGWKKLGTITDLTQIADTTVHGVMLDDQEPITLALALHMQETAGNEYQNLTVGDGFAVQLYAAQYTHEDDSFNNLYDLNAPFVTLPTAKVDKLPDPSVFGTFVPVNAERDQGVDVGYTFTATEEDVTQSEYKEWHADFVISFSKDVNPGVIGLAGQYANEWTGDGWLGFDIDEDIIKAALKDENATVLPANTVVRMLSTANIQFSYEMICDLVKQFNCGTYAITDEAKGITATVELRLYEPADDATNTDDETETGKYVTVGQFIYTY